MVKECTIAVAMSGGVDSSVAAALLRKEGWDVVGVTMRIDLRSRGGSFCNDEAIARAADVCQTMGIQHRIFDLTEPFSELIVEYFVDEYLHGKTPNPCTRCNASIKWGKLREAAQDAGCEYLATGHYAQIQSVDGEMQLHRAAYRKKDQSYALWAIPYNLLPKTRLPLGALKKEQVRKIAAELDFVTADTPESQEICFIPDNDYGAFLKQQRPGHFNTSIAGDIVDRSTGEDEVVGQHQGLPFYTIGQRKGLGGGFSAPRYVIDVDAQSNRIIIGRKEQLLQKRFLADQLNWLIPEVREEVRADVQVRYHATQAPAIIEVKGETAKVTLDEPVEAISPGQSAVFYQGDRLIGGGRITEIVAD
ncbi:tRNA 2-thiouridine(34) synthase MnmA [bacterium]|nr:tRNA 2-thiouridine(34) synthase MnmA [bacterium]MBU1651079.1 tRNA 2-thiouridine(34) synthase MnmA [bacterium]MBU1881697.1 tRNA 2-thiouridine(34) synthase MnmA [bacterium]